MPTYGFSDIDLFLVNGLQAHNETTDLKVEGPKAGTVDVTRTGQDYEEKKFNGILEARLSQTVLYDSAAPSVTDELFNLTGGVMGAASRVAGLPVALALAGATRGKSFIGMASMQASVGARETKKGDVQRVTVEYENTSLGGFGDGKIIDWGSCAAGVSSGYVDMGAANTYGGYFHVHLLSVTSTPTQVAVKLQSCASSGGTYTDVAGVTTGTIAVSTFPIGVAIKIPSGTNILQYVKAFYTFTGGTAPTVLAFAGLVENTTAS